MFGDWLSSWKRDPIGAGKALPSEEVDRLTVAKLGPRPVTDPRNPRDSQIIGSLNLGGRVAEFSEDERRAEDELARQPNRWGVGVSLAALFVVECLGAIQVMKSLGMENPQRTIVGIALAAFIFFLTNQARTGTRRRLLYVAFGAYSLLILAVTIVRMGEVSSGEDGSILIDIAGAIILLFSTIGPALLYEKLVPAWERSSLAAKERWQARGRRRRTEREQRTAQKYMRRLGERQAQYDNRSSRFKARFQVDSQSGQ